MAVFSSFSLILAIFPPSHFWPAAASQGGGAGAGGGSTNPAAASRGLEHPPREHEGVSSCAPVWFRFCDIPIFGALSFFATVDLLLVCLCRLICGLCIRQRMAHSLHLPHLMVAQWTILLSGTCHTTAAADHWRCRKGYCHKGSRKGGGGGAGGGGCFTGPNP